MDKTKILVVDDALFMRKLLGNTLKDIGYSNIVFAQDGYEAVDKAREIQPEVVTLDVSMPGMDGLEAIKKILQVSCDSKIIMVSAVTSEKVIQQAMKNGAVAYIPKPFSRKDVENGLRQCNAYIE
ncbi:MAG TPA: response regulator [Hungateiclostridium thermocellum]|jgi:two-component system chemotaxis response regulator CheY|uniref:Stage 0 sporulation protein A homolog n=2 Tax=Acetivibrio thermocellus TaxID=1515 RepID=A3DF83_ACET2|nr:response regulator [Acetivibrio thermocellus]CDG36056.1 response regulator receiver protein [Acetivibrio thermocellus BC1]ABN52612.1 response regulator receiver protein [Acetivibrio thermocellus ATCC 27405]ADU73936.1 response regulator receiver protein [Acetivibrio thermocellus DSM 1313]ALX07874.1 response regulator receiver protein [Acetivibrio thermocellus AD2]ANV75620.1 response regulator receiver protein [Acetivibrio thermocellus DSM 2360]